MSSKKKGKGKNNTETSSLDEGFEAGGPLPGDLARVAEVAGEQAARKIARAFRGTTLYVPDIERPSRDDEIRKDYDGGMNVRGIAVKHRITERQVRRILKGT